ncbi:MAG TPA: amidohydrolase family protein [Bryobacteraceae bacterium]|nr:amidohydrolase family protein [Bryobacteraceae bacterium]HOL70785.1 amidohydrolase family protein [Bryobacteraceae bacterium]HOQ44504.1 amidohydrolase family protein [Bryobacteraceae bacterium]HPQ16480.1 amidohydrolase family protein [Bryobacteraceae bacterium]HPU70823.1 amidohydrolase family protein [Bryobacteraceae bacterium]
MTSIIGATLIDGTGRAPVPDSVVLVVGSRVGEAGPRASVPTPARAVNVNGAGKFVTPQLIDLNRDELPVASTNDELRKLIESGAAAYGGLPEDIDPVLLARLIDSKAVFAPGLSQLNGRALERAKQQTRKLADAGLRIAVASAGDPEHELKLLLEAGFSPMEVIVAATHNGALAQRKSHEVGTLTSGKYANLVLLPTDPLEDVCGLARPERIMVEGRWVD